jgi:dihydroxy-acid dehydratase
MLQKPVVGIAYTPSGFNNCHRHFPELLDAVKRGVLAAGALPIDFPTISLGEVFLSPTSLKYRNLMSIDTEEMVRAQPMDAVVLMGGCDKTVPAQLMGAVSAGRAASGSARAPIAAASGDVIAPATSAMRRFRRSRASSRSPPALARSWARLPPWPASPRRSGSFSPVPRRSRPCMPIACARRRRPARRR